MPLDSPIRLERAETIADLLSSLGFQGIVKFDRLEPEYRAFEVLHQRGIRPEYLGLVAILAGIVDFQLGKGGAGKFWETLEEVSRKTEKLEGLRQIEALMENFLNRPINARIRDTKIRRIERVFTSGFAEWFVENYDAVKREPLELWVKLANTLHSKMEQKTIVFAMKAFDLAHLITEGDYADFPENIPIPVDFHVRNVAISSGLLSHHASDDIVREAWANVSRRVSEKLGRHISLLRIDSLVWQVGKIMYECGFVREHSLKSIERYFAEEVGIDQSVAKRLSEELTRYIENVEP